MSRRLRPHFLSWLLLSLLFSGTAYAQSTAQPVPGVPNIGGRAFGPPPPGYVVEEFFLSGRAQAFEANGPLGPDGRWAAWPADTAPFVTRVIVVRPHDSDRFNGSVLVEWLNVSGGTDLAADWTMMRRELVRGGYAYVGISVQRAGIEAGSGGPSFGAPLKVADPGRYGRLQHPGDAYSYDIFSQGGAAIRNGGLLGGLQPRRLIASGASQSAAYLTTYINAIDPLAGIFDGFLSQVRKRSAAPLDGDVFAAWRSGSGPFALPYVRIREDVRVPVLMFISEQDLMDEALGFIAARQPDTDRLRTWEVAGTAHGNIYGFSVSPIDDGAAAPSALARAFAPTRSFAGRTFERPFNASPQHHYVMQAALDQLNAWVTRGQAPQAAQPLRTTSTSPPTLVLDANGNAQGGVRSPWMDVPIARHSGLGQRGDYAAGLMGVTEPFSAAELTRLYPGGRQDYLARFAASLDESIRDGFILAADREEILAVAAAMYLD